MNLLLGILVVIIGVLLLITVLDWVIVGFARPSFLKKPNENYFVQKTKNRLALQRSTECSGFSSAHVMRSFGVEADGNELYAKMPGKLKNGAVLPKNLKKMFRRHGFRARFVCGSLDSMKAELSKGNRVIAFIRTRLDKNWLHYVPIVGYNEEEIFIAESLRYLTNCGEEFYNRKVSAEEFLKYWNIRTWYMPWYKNTYLVIERKE